MGILLKIIAICVCLAMLYWLGKQIIKKNLSESQAIFWIAGVLGLLVLSVFPKILLIVAGWLGIWWPPATLLFFLVILLLIIVLLHTITLSKREAEIIEMAMQISLLKDEIEELKEEKALDERGEN